MKRTLCRVSVALLTLALGITITRFLRSHAFVDQVSPPPAESVFPVQVPAKAQRKPLETRQRFAPLRLAREIFFMPVLMERTPRCSAALWSTHDLWAN